GPVTLAQTGTFTITVNPGADMLGTASGQVSISMSRADAEPSAPATAAEPPEAPAPAAPAPAPAAPSAEDWHPGQVAALPRDFQTHRAPSPSQSQPALRAPAGA